MYKRKTLQRSNYIAKICRRVLYARYLRFSSSYISRNVFVFVADFQRVALCAVLSFFRQNTQCRGSLGKCRKLIAILRSGKCSTESFLHMKMWVHVCWERVTLYRGRKVIYITNILFRGKNFFTLVNAHTCTRSALRAFGNDRFVINDFCVFRRWAENHLGKFSPGCRSRCCHFFVAETFLQPQCKCP